MLISLCIPIMNRLAPFQEALPCIIHAANYSPPCEIVVVNYNSSDGLDDYMQEMMCSSRLLYPNYWTYRCVYTHKFYNSAHARNLCAKASSGEYLLQLSAEALPLEHAIALFRTYLMQSDFTWMCEAWLGRWILIKRQEFMDAGGYDERFSAYAPEDRDICSRLHRRDGKFATFPARLIREIPTTNADKLKNLDIEPYKNDGIWVKRSMSHRMHAIYNENNAKKVLVANEGKEWGKGL